MHWAPVAVFGALVILAPLLFGAVDRFVQVALVAIFGVGMILRPPSLVPLSHRANHAIALLLLVLVMKEFAPWEWFGGARWRSAYSTNLGISFPKTHHPEPQRALDALLAGVVALLWFQWTRTLASERGTRRVMGWVLFGAGVAVAVVCFAMGRREVGAEGGMIYGLRFTTSWAGWGPFPNRNHTACFLAMSLLVGSGCIAWAVVKRRASLIVAGALGLLLIAAALLSSRSRGGLVVALGIGLLVFGGFVLVRFFSTRTLVLVLAAGAFVTTAIMLFGGDVLARFQSQEAGGVSNSMRVAIWKDTLSMWKDAPLFGHGLETFAQLFPTYQTVELDGAFATHPESSWLAWMAEVGIVPLGVGIIALVVFVGSNLGAVLERRGGFFISIGALTGFVGFLAHSAVDIPAHRWGTAAFALALLAVACPLRSPDAPLPPASRLSAAVPFAVAVFWLLPLAGLGPAWSPMEPLLLMERDNWFATGGRSRRPPRPTVQEWQTAASYFPLDWEVQQTTAMRELESEIPRMKEGKPLAHIWQWRFDVVSHLAPGLYGESMKQAIAAAQFSKGLSIGYWQDAVDKAQHSKSEVLRIAVRETSAFPSATGLWEAFCLARPALLPVYIALVIDDIRLPAADVRPLFDAWWEQRALTAELSDEERSAFHRYGHQWVTIEQVEQWIKRNAARRKQDYRQWGTLLQKQGGYARAWEILSGVEKEPGPIDMPRGATIASMSELMVSTPDNFSNIASLVTALESAGKATEARRIVVDNSRRPNAPKWFLYKAAYALAAEGKQKDAVELMLRAK